MKYLLSLLITVSAQAQSIEQKAKDIEQKLDRATSKAEAAIEHFDRVVLPWLDEQDRKRKERLEQKRKGEK